MAQSTKDADPHYLSIFTPSQTDPKDLEAIFVQREALLADAIERIIESVKTKNKQHQLMVGNRGSGKTHLVSLLVHRLKQKKALNKKLKIAWLNEDETCTSFLDVLLNTFDALNKLYPKEFSKVEKEAVYDKTPDGAQSYLSELLVEKLKKSKQTCLIIIENLDALFESIGSIGQKQLRAYLQENPLFTLFTTAQKLSDHLKNRNDPFFGFFQTEHLKPLSEAQASGLISKIAELQNKEEVTSFLKTHKGKMRIKALHHLSGGNHRVYLVLSQFISRDSIDALVPPFLKMVDEMTPYYQERLRWLPPVQRKIIETLSTTRTTLSVKQIARRLFSSNQTISSQLKELKEKGYVKSHKRGRESLYEMTEPLMRICVEVKDNQGNKPIAILVEFIRAWYDGHELINRLDKKELSQLSQQYLSAAYEKSIQVSCDFLHGKGLIQTSKVEAFLTDTEKARQLLSLADYTKIIESSDSSCEQAAEALYDRGMVYYQQDELEKALTDWSQLIELPEAPTERVAKALHNRGVVYFQQDKLEKALIDWSQLIELPDAPIERVAKALHSRGVVYHQQDEPEKTLADWSQLIELPDAPMEQVTQALFNRGYVYMQQGELEKALADFTLLIELPSAPMEQVTQALSTRGRVYVQQGELEKALVDFTLLIELPDAPTEQVAEVLHIRGITYVQQGELEKALADFTLLIELPNVPTKQVAEALHIRGIAYAQQGELEKALVDFSLLIELPGAPVEQVTQVLFYSAMVLIYYGHWKKAKIFLVKALSIETDVPIDYYFAGVIDALNTGLYNKKIRQKIITELVQICSVNHHAFNQLGTGLVSNLASLLDDKLLKDNLISWCDTWKSAMQEYAELEVSLRIFLIGMEYLLANNDEAVLLELVESERSILWQVFQLDG